MPGVCIEIYRTVVARAEGGELTRVVKLPEHLKLDPDEANWLKRVAGVRDIVYDSALTSPSFE